MPCDTRVVVKEADENDLCASFRIRSQPARRSREVRPVSQVNRGVAWPTAETHPDKS